MKCEKVKEYIGQYLNQCYKNQKFCDVTIVADSTQIQCHKIVLASVSPFLKDVLTSPGQNEDVDGNTVLNLSEFNPKEVKSMSLLVNLDISFQSWLAGQVFNRQPLLGPRIQKRC